MLDVEYVVITQERNLFDFARFFVLLLNPFPEDNHAGLFALLHIAASLLNLRICGIFAGTAQEHLIEEAVRLAGCVGDCCAACDPRFAPRNDAVFHLLYDSGDSVLLKRFYRLEKERKYLLHAENPVYDDIILDECDVIGVAVKVLKDL